MMARQLHACTYLPAQVPKYLPGQIIEGEGRELGEARGHVPSPPPFHVLVLYLLSLLLLVYLSRGCPDPASHFFLPAKFTFWTYTSLPPALVLHLRPCSPKTPLHTKSKHTHTHHG